MFRIHEEGHGAAWGGWPPWGSGEIRDRRVLGGGGKPRQGSISVAVLLVLVLVLGPAGSAEPRTPKPVKVLPRSSVFFLPFPTHTGFSGEQQHSSAPGCDQQPQSSSYLV